MDTVTFFPGRRSGDLMTYWGRVVAFPARSTRVRVEDGDEFEVLSATPNAKGSVYFLTLGKRVSTQASRDAARAVEKAAEEAAEKAREEEMEAYRRESRIRDQATLAETQAALRDTFTTRITQWDIRQTLTVTVTGDGLSWQVASVGEANADHYDATTIRAMWDEQRTRYAHVFDALSLLSDRLADVVLFRDTEYAPVFRLSGKTIQLSNTRDVDMTTDQIVSLVIEKSDLTAMRQRIESLVDGMGTVEYSEFDTASIRIPDPRSDYSYRIAMRDVSAESAIQTLRTWCERYRIWHATRANLADVAVNPLRIKQTRELKYVSADDRVAHLFDLLSPNQRYTGDGKDETIIVSVHDQILRLSPVVWSSNPGYLSSDERTYYGAGPDTQSQYAAVEIPVVVV